MNRVKKAMEHYVSSSRVDWLEATGEFDAFDIRFYS